MADQTIGDLGLCARREEMEKSDRTGESRWSCGKKILNAAVNFFFVSYI